MFIITTLYIALTFEMCPLFWDLVDNGLFDKPYFFYISVVFCLFINYFIVWWKEAFNNNKDVIIRFLTLCVRPFTILVTLLYGHLKGYYYYLRRESLRVVLKTFYI